MGESMSGKKFDIHQLARASGLNERTIHYYRDIGLLPPPKGNRRAAVYGERHLKLLLDIRRLKFEGHTLGSIKQILNQRPSKAVIATVRPEAETRCYLEISNGLWVCYDLKGPWRNERKLRGVLEAASEAAREVAEG